jgi:cell wall-associated NlpC family hydrolase
MHSSHHGASMRAPRLTLTRLATIVLTTAFAVSGLAGVAPHASAANSTARITSATQSTSSTTQHRTASQRYQARADHVLRVARNQAGDPYQYGAAGPSRFDCSGLVMYVFKHALDRSLPHNAESQYQRSRHITRSHVKRGDLVFQVDSSGYAFHVGIYAGHGYMWHAPHSGSHVRKQKLWSGRWRFGRIIRRS